MIIGHIVHCIIMAVSINLNSEPLLPFNHLDDTAFSVALYELEHGPLNFDLDRPLRDINI